MKKMIMVCIAGLLTAVFACGIALGESREKQEEKAGSAGMEQPAKAGKTGRFGQQTNLQPVAGLDNFTVENLKGERLGRVQDVFVDIGQGRIGYVVVGTDVPVETAEQYVIPWGALKPSAQTGVLVLQSDRTDLREVPAQDLLQALQGEEGRKVHQYYGVAPYWEESGK